MPTVEELKSKVETHYGKLKWVVTIGAVILLTPLMILAIKAIFVGIGLALAIMLAGGVAFALSMFVPVFVDKMKNARIQAIIDEAEAKPIPTLWAQHEKEAQELKAFRADIENYAAQLLRIQDKADSLSGDLTAADQQRFQADIALMSEDLRLQEEDLQTALEDLDKFETEIRRASAIWDVKMAMSAANASNIRARGLETMDKIRRETALDAVSTSMSRSKAQLRTRILSRSRAAFPPQPEGVQTPSAAVLEVHQPEVIDLQPVNFKEGIRK